jgi:hypothetical protein
LAWHEKCSIEADKAKLGNTLTYQGGAREPKAGPTVKEEMQVL